MITHQSACTIVGGGPAGMFLGLLLARGGVEVTVLEKHTDFLRDFRGDTVHVSTLNIIDELGLADRFAALPQQRTERGTLHLDQGSIQMGDMTRLRGRHRHIALVPQWDLLDMLSDAARAEPSFTLRQNAECTELMREDGRVVGVRFTDRTDGSAHELRSTLTVGCDGRRSVVRAAAGLVPRTFEVPMDLWWFRLPRHAGDPVGAFERSSPGHFLVMIDRGEYWQCAYFVPKGADAAMRADGIEAFRRRLRGVLPWLGDRVDELGSFDDVKLLAVSLERLRRWYTDGLLLIGDAAHTMSPVGGVGINLAVADAVAAGRILGPALRTGNRVPTSVLRRVQRRRWLPTVLIQGLQKQLHSQLGAVLAQPVHDAPTAVEFGREAPTESLPLPMRIVRRFPALQVLPAWVTAIGPLPEHVPAWARRPTAAAPAVRSD